MQLCEGALVLHDDGAVAYCTEAPPTAAAAGDHDCGLERHRTFVSCPVFGDDSCPACRRTGAERGLALTP